MPSDSFSTVRGAYKEYISKDLKIVGVFFMAWVTISYVAHRLGFKMPGVFETTFDAFHEWAHIVLDVFVFSWVTYCLEWLWYGFTWLCSLVLPVIPWRPQLLVPDAVIDFALVSLVLTRVFGSTDVLVPRAEREQAAHTPELKKQEREIEGPFWGRIHRALDDYNRWVYNFRDWLLKPFDWRPLVWIPRVQTIAKLVLTGLAGAVLMQGFVRFAGYSVNLYACRGWKCPMLEVRRRVYRYFWLNFLGAIGAFLVFYWASGWFVQALQQ